MDATCCLATVLFSLLEVSQGGAADPQHHWGQLPPAGRTSQLSRAEQGNHSNLFSSSAWLLVRVILCSWAWWAKCLCFHVTLSGLCGLSERPVLWWDGGVALSFAVLVSLSFGIHSYSLLPPWSLEEFSQVRWTTSLHPVQHPIWCCFQKWHNIHAVNYSDLLRWMRCIKSSCFWFKYYYIILYHFYIMW